MRFRRYAHTLGFVLALGCADRATGPYPVSAPMDVRDSAIGPGDVFEVHVYNEPDLSGVFQVASDGTIDYPFLGALTVAGKTPPQVAHEIQDKLADGYLKRPQVYVLVKESNSKKITIFGQVRQPGTFPYASNMSIVEAITRAGGFTSLAKKNSVRVTRRLAPNDLKIIIVAVEDIGQGKAPNFLLRPGDMVLVPERLF